MTELIYGRNAVRECLRARRRHIHRLLLAQGIKPGPIVSDITARAQRLNLPIQHVPRHTLNTRAAGHQGVALETGRLPTLHLTDILSHSQKQGESAFILALDHLEDPHNVGALLRTAEAVGVHGVIIPARRAAQITPAVVNTSAGASEHLPIAVVPNMAQTLNALKTNNIWVIGVEKTAAAQPYHTADLNRALTLVLGNEGKGLSRLVRQICDALIALPMRGQLNSLNASVAGALALYEAWRARQFCGQ
ncbi:MAG: 23S rRNA (guanosine(2251)-2'-O)-methyltransferase RlmB [Anaerolineae bacterium]